MIRSYEDGLRWLLGLTSRGIEPGLERVRAALRLLGHPERRVPSIVVGGTNGKGSVATFIARVAWQQGLSTGLFTSPHLHRLTERIRVDGREIGRRALVESLRRVQAIADADGGPRLTFFEALTVAAADLFAAAAVDLAVLEVGLGGRLDATAVFPARVVVLTSIALDHQQYLGDTIEEIADEKFALARRGAIVVAGELQPSLVPRLEAKARAVRAPLWRARRDFDWSIDRRGRLRYDGPFGALEGVPVPLRGAHQAHNLAVGITALAALARRGIEPAEERHVRAALRGLRWPGRLELRQGRRLLFDVAHNPAGAEALCREIPSLLAGKRPVVVVFGCMRDKDVAGIARPIRAVADDLLLVAPRMPRALPPEDFPASLGGEPFPSIEAAVDEARRRAGEGGAVVITGSTFVVADARAYALGLTKVDPSIPM